ncbi:MAG: DUF2795 domain-containing protein [Thermomicrobiales bacterium]
MFDKIKETLTGATDSTTNAGAGAYAAYLKGIDFPISKSQLLDQLQQNGADEAIIEHVRLRSQDHFDRAEDVFQSLF